MSIFKAILDWQKTRLEIKAEHDKSDPIELAELHHKLSLIRKKKTEKYFNKVIDKR